MVSRQTHLSLTLVSAFLLVVALGGCAAAETVKEEVEEKIELAGMNIQSEVLSNMSCEEIINMSIEGGEGHGVPGVAGAERWGMPEGAASTMRVRRSWTTLSDADKKQVVDAFNKLKQTTIAPGRLAPSVPTMIPSARTATRAISTTSTSNSTWVPSRRCRPTT